MSPRALTKTRAAGAGAFGPAEREAFLARLWAMDAALQRAGFHALSPWWRAEVTRFVRGGCKRWVIRAGRRAGKSSTLARLAVAVAWFGSWSVPTGDVAIIPFVSVSKEEAGARLRTIGAILTALDIAHEPRGEEIEMTAPRTVVFKAIACTTKASVGFTSIFIACDEVAKWESRETGANPAAEVIGSLAPTMATQPNAWLALSSSPWSQDDYHAARYDEGDGAAQAVSYAPTWVANPKLTEAATHELEPDPRTWQREYEAIPGVTVSAALDRLDVLACFGRGLPDGFHSGWLALDPSSLRGDAFAHMAGVVSADGELVVREVGGWEGEELRHVSMADVVSTVAGRARALRISTVFSDQREEASLRSMFGEHDVALKSYAWTEQSKDDAMQRLRRLMRERRLHLPEHARLRNELIGMKARLVPSGRTRYETNGLDYASCLITLMHAIADHRVHLDSDGDDNNVIFTIPSERNGGPQRVTQHGGRRSYGDAVERRRRFMNDE